MCASSFDCRPFRHSDVYYRVYPPLLCWRGFEELDFRDVLISNDGLTPLVKFGGSLRLKCTEVNSAQSQIY